MKMNKLMISNRVLEAVKTHLEVSAPYVAGGFLFGRPIGEKSSTEITDFKPALNIVEGIPNQFFYSQYDFKQSGQHAQKRNQRISGIYASISSKVYDLDKLFMNDLDQSNYFLVGIIQGNELVSVDTYYRDAGKLEKCSINVVEALEV